MAIRWSVADVRHRSRSFANAARSIVAITSRVECVLGSPAMATRPAGGAHRSPLGHGLLGVVRSLGVHVGTQARDQRVGGVLLEHDHVVDRAQRRDSISARSRGGHQRPARPLEPAPPPRRS